MSYDAGLLVLRLIVGLLLAGHGAQKLFGWSGGPGFVKFAQHVEHLGFRPGWLWAALATAGEFGGGLALALGFLMPLPAVGIIAAMAIAVFKVHWKNGLWAMKGGIEYPLTLLVVAAVLGLLGPGRYSLDRLFGLSLPNAPVFWIGLAVALISIVAAMLTGGRNRASTGAKERAA